MMRTSIKGDAVSEKDIGDAVLVSQDPEDSRSHTYRLLRQHLRSPDLLRVRVSVAYVTWGGLSLVADDLEVFLSQGKFLETIYGVNNNVTTPDALFYSVYLRKRFKNYRIAQLFSSQYADSEFHPKYLEFQYPDRSVHVVGSGNLTRGGLAANHELGVALTTPSLSEISRDAHLWWERCLKRGQAITPSLIRKLVKSEITGRESRGKRNGDGLAALGLRLPSARKPLFDHILEGELSGNSRTKLLENADILSEKPRRLYLQILEKETGGHGNGKEGAGYQVQLPVETLGAFFGVGPGDEAAVRFFFPELSQSVEVQLTHFQNATHRVRLRPLKDVPRPAIVVFERTRELDYFICKIVPPRQYKAVLSKECNQQTTTKSRRWGMR